MMPKMGENDLAKTFWHKKKKQEFYDFCDFDKIDISLILILDLVHHNPFFD